MFSGNSCQPQRRHDWSLLKSVRMEQWCLISGNSNAAAAFWGEKTMRRNKTVRTLKAKIVFVVLNRGEYLLLQIFRPDSGSPLCSSLHHSNGTPWLMSIWSMETVTAIPLRGVLPRVYSSPDVGWFNWHMQVQWCYGTPSCISATPPAATLDAMSHKVSVTSDTPVWMFQTV